METPRRETGGKKEPLSLNLELVSYGILAYSSSYRGAELSAEMWLSPFCILHVNGDYPFKYLLCLATSRSEAQRS